MKKPRTKLKVISPNPIMEYKIVGFKLPESGIPEVVEIGVAEDVGVGLKVGVGVAVGDGVGVEPEGVDSKAGPSDA